MDIFSRRLFFYVGADPFSTNGYSILGKFSPILGAIRFIWLTRLTWTLMILPSGATTRQLVEQNCMPMATKSGICAADSIWSQGSYLGKDKPVYDLFQKRESRLFFATVSYEK